MRQNESSASGPRTRGRIRMVAVTTFIVAMLLNAWVGDAAAQSERLTRELGARAAQYIATWNTHDSEALARYFTPDADMIMGNGPILFGRGAIDIWWREYFAVQESDRELTIDILSTRSITEDVALLNVLTTIGGQTAQDQLLPPRKARGTWVLVRQGGEWQISSMRGMPTEQDGIIRRGG
jgi:uncharacterized protein (TIGR02246 family)